MREEESCTPAVHNAPVASTATRPTDVKPEPTADTEPKPTTMSAPEVIPELKIIPETEPDNKSDQVPATVSLPVDILVEYEGMEWSPVPSTVADVSALN